MMPIPARSREYRVPHWMAAEPAVRLPVMIGDRQLSAFAAAEVERAARRERLRQHRLAAARMAAHQAARALRAAFGEDLQVIAFGSVIDGARFRLDSDVDLAVSGLPSGRYYEAWALAEAAVREAGGGRVDLLDLDDAPAWLAEVVRLDGEALRMTEPERRAAELRTLLARLGRQREVIRRVAARTGRAATRAATGDAEAIAQMKLDIPAVRPRLVAAATAADLDLLHRFRHRVRHAYEEEYDWRRMEEPLQALDRLEGTLHADFERMQASLHEMVRALEAA
jgi:predicted nucleotidyltransferase